MHATQLAYQQAHKALHDAYYSLTGDGTKEEWDAYDIAKQAELAAEAALIEWALSTVKPLASKVQYQTILDLKVRSERHYILRCKLCEICLKLSA